MSKKVVRTSNGIRAEKGMKKYVVISYEKMWVAHTKEIKARNKKEALKKAHINGEWLREETCDGMVEDTEFARSAANLGMGQADIALFQSLAREFK